MKWKRNLALRLVMLADAGITEDIIRKASGWSSQWWGKQLKNPNPTANTMKTMGMLLACPVSVLIQSDPSPVVTAFIPDWDWLQDFNPDAFTSAEVMLHHQQLKHDG